MSTHKAKAWCSSQQRFALGFSAEVSVSQGVSPCLREFWLETGSHGGRRGRGTGSGRGTMGYGGGRPLVRVAGEDGRQQGPEAARRGTSPVSSWGRRWMDIWP